MNIRDERQEEAKEAYLGSVDKKSIIYACPRFGKIKVACSIMIEIKAGKVLIVAPRKDIFKGWVDDFKKFGYVFMVDFCTFAGIKNLKDTYKYDLIIVDEPHELSLNQQALLRPHIDNVVYVLGLTGTMTQKTRNEMYDNLNMDVCYNYSIEEGVQDEILTDYQIFIHHVPLDNIKKTYGKYNRFTEKKWFDIAMSIREGEGQDPRTIRTMDLRMISIIQNSLGKMKKTKELIGRFHNERILVFCGVTAIADKLGIPVYHSKKREIEIFHDFCVSGGKIDQLATIKMMQAGITINPINKGIINYMSGNPEDSAQKICRFLGFEYDNPDKKAEVHIVSTDEPFEISRLRTGLGFFNQDKIKTCV